MILKKRLAQEIVSQLYNQKAADEAEEQFTKVFQKRELPEEIPEYHLSFKAHAPAIPLGQTDMSRVLVTIKMAESRSEANRLIRQGAVEIDGKQIDHPITSDLKDSSTIKVGKSRFARVINTD